MTKETKIGLLVGLTFIIVIGILLTDYGSNAPRARQPLFADVDSTLPGRNHAGPIVVPPTPTPPPVIPPRPVVPPSPPAQRDAAYTVRPGDTLWRIAVQQCGDGHLVKKIKEMNQDLLKGSERLHPNMVLKLPAKVTTAGD